MKLIKAWWHAGWALADTIVLGAAGMSSVLYVRYLKEHVDPKPPWLEFWPGLTIEILGAWASVRIIDHLIKRRERRSEARWRIVRIVNYVRDLAREVSPVPRRVDVARLEDEIKYFPEEHNAALRRKYLTRDEQEDVATAMAQAETLTAACRTFVELWQTLESIEFHHSATEDSLYEAGDSSRPVRQTYQRARDYYRDLFLGAAAPNAYTAVDPVSLGDSATAVPADVMDKIGRFCSGVPQVYEARGAVERAASALGEAVEKARANIIEEERHFA